MKIEGEMSSNELDGDCIFSDNARQDCSQQFITFSISSTIIIITVTITTTMFSISEHIIVLDLNLCLYLYYLCQRLAKHSVNVNSQMDGIDHPFEICCHSAFIWGGSWRWWSSYCFLAFLIDKPVRDAMKSFLLRHGLVPGRGLVCLLAHNES